MSVAGQRPIPAIEIRQWIHANICVRDLTRSIAFYERLGFEAFHEQVFEDGAQTWAGLGLAGTGRMRAVFMRMRGGRKTPFLDLLQFLDPPTAGSAYPTLNHVGIGRLCFEVADLDAAEALLRASGVEFVGPVVPYESAPGVKCAGVDARFVCFRDPDGTVIEFAQFVRGNTDVAQG